MRMVMGMGMEGFEGWDGMGRWEEGGWGCRDGMMRFWWAGYGSSWDGMIGCRRIYPDVHIWWSVRKEIPQ